MNSYTHEFIVDEYEFIYVCTWIHIQYYILWIHIPLNSYSKESKLWIHSRDYEFIPNKNPDGFIEYNILRVQCCVHCTIQMIIIHLELYIAHHIWYNNHHLQLWLSFAAAAFRYRRHRTVRWLHYWINSAKLSCPGPGSFKPEPQQPRSPSGRLGHVI
jgi:hypothetical protein